MLQKTHEVIMSSNSTISELLQLEASTFSKLQIVRYSIVGVSFKWRYQHSLFMDPWISDINHAQIKTQLISKSKDPTVDNGYIYI